MEWCTDSVEGAMATLRRWTIAAALGFLATLGTVGRIHYHASAAIPPPPPPPPSTAPASPVPSQPPDESPTPAVTIMPVPTTPTASVTTTAVPAPALILHAWPSPVSPGRREIVYGATVPEKNVILTLRYPNGDTGSRQEWAGPRGHFGWTFVVPRSEVRHIFRWTAVTASVTTAQGTSTQQTGFRLNYGPVDVSSQPRKASVGSLVSIWVHSSAYARVFAYLLYPNREHASFEALTGPRGWDDIRVRVPRHVTTRYHTVTVVAQIDPGPHLQSATTTFTIR